MSPTCRDCGISISRYAERCRMCNVREMARLAAIEHDDDDQELLRLIDVAGLTATRVSRREGISRPAMERKIAKARRRQALLEY